MNKLPFSNVRLLGQAVKTSPFHGGNPGSIPGRVTKKRCTFVRRFSFCFGGFFCQKSTLDLCRQTHLTSALEGAEVRWGFGFSPLFIKLYNA